MRRMKRLGRWLWDTGDRQEEGEKLEIVYKNTLNKSNSQGLKIEIKSNENCK